MAGPWLYVISASSGAKFALEGESVDATVDNFRKLVENGRLVEDRYWGGKHGIRRNWKNVQRGDDLFIYTSDGDWGIIGNAKITDVQERGNGRQLELEFDLEKCRALLKHPIRPAVVSAWKLSLRSNVIDLAPVEKELQALLPREFSAALPVNVEEKDLTDKEIDKLLRENRLRIGMVPIDGVVPTDTREVQARQRRGQDRIRALTVKYYGGRCAVCDVADNAFLIASHIVGWAESPDHRGDLSNVICLCRFHDALFEAGYWSLADSLDLLKKQSVTSKTICHLLDAMVSFRKPVESSPAREFLARHREKAGFAVQHRVSSSTNQLENHDRVLPTGREVRVSISPLADRIRVVEADITRLKVDAIVNAANKSLRRGGGVCGEIHDAAGPELEKECLPLAPCRTGDARLTSGHDLPAKHVIHAVGPDYGRRPQGAAGKLRACYDSCLRLAAEHKLHTIAFPSISTGIFRFPKEDACLIATEAVVNWLRSSEYPREVTFCLRKAEDADRYRQSLRSIIGI